LAERRNVLITSAGRRTFLVEAFKAALEGAGLVVAGDVDPLAPALFLADRAERLPRLQANDYADSLLELVSRAEIGAIIPTIDTELRQLAQMAPQLRSIGAEAVISESAFIDITMDKWLTVQAFGEHAVAMPKTWLPEDLERADLPDRLVVKPRLGSASQGILHVSKEHVRQAVDLTDQPIVQEELDGAEVTVDALFDMNGRLIHYVPRVRLKAIGGESVEGITIARDGIGPWIETVLDICGRLGARGPVTLQYFSQPSGPQLTEVNARFGGGFPLTYRAGGRYPEWLLRDLRGLKLEPRIGDYAVGVRMTRHYREIFPQSPAW
jgi:carbamoyl-phosphate synthase large subunit